MRRGLPALIATVLALFALAPTLPAGAARGVAFEVFDSTSHEYGTYCMDYPGPCNVVHGTSLNFTIQYTWGSQRPNRTVTIGYQIVDVTTTNGQDYQVAATGTVSIAANASMARVTIPIIDDGVAEPTETLQLRLTSSSVSANISDVGIGTIHDGSDIPADCSAAWVDPDTKSLTCTDRPAAQNWRFSMYCVSMAGVEEVAIGNTVAGNGTSVGRCSIGLPNSEFFTVV